MTQKAHDSHIAQIFFTHFAVDSHTHTLEGGGEYTLLNENNSRIDLSKSSESNSISESATNLSADSIDSQYLSESSGKSNNDSLDSPIDSIDSHDLNTHDSHFDSHFNYSLCASHYTKNNNMPLDSHDSPTNPKRFNANQRTNMVGFIVRDDFKLYFNLKDTKWRN